MGARFGVVSNNIVITDDTGKKIGKVHITAYDKKSLTEIATKMFTAFGGTNITVASPGEPIKISTETTLSD